MLKNNIEIDIKTKCIENNKSQAEIAETINSTKSYVNRIIKNRKGILNNTFVKIMDALGYDIELIYIKKDEHLL